MTEAVYLDNHSSTKPFSSVLSQVEHWLSEYWPSMGSPHFLGQRASFPCQKSIQHLYETLGAKPDDQCFFHSNSIEALSQVLWNTYLHESREKGKTLFITTEGENPGCTSALDRLEQLGCTTKTLPVNLQGHLTREALSAALTPRTALVSLSWANSLTGVVHPIHDLAQVCKEKNVLLHVDASYVFARHFFRFEEMDIPILTLDGNVLHAPKGSAVTMVKSHVPYRPLGSALSDWNVPSIFGFTQSLQIMHEHFEHYCTETSRLKDRLEEGILREYPDAKVLYQTSERVPDCTAIAFPGVFNEALLYMINAQGVYATMGGGNLPLLTPMLIKMGVEEKLAYSALSFCLSCETTETDVDHAISVITSAARQLRACSEHLF